MIRLDDDALARLREAADLPDLTGTRYEIVGRLDRGGMATVYRARDRALDREVALKVLSAPDPGGDLAARMQEEARHLARLEHPNIVPVHDAGALPDGRVYCVMKLVRGRRLDVWAREPDPGGAGRPARLRLFQKICGAVAFAHSRGVIHRDLKPENVMVGSFGEALVMDWGVALRLDGGGPAGPADSPAPPGPDDDAAPGRARTARGTILGTPAYMAPEQARGENGMVGPRTDVYALGAILYFLLAGRAPFEGGSARAILEQAARGAPDPLRRLDPAIPRPLEAIVARAMAADPASRYASAQELADDVERFLDGQPALAYPENLLEKALRLADRHRALVWLVAAYLLMRMTMLAFTGR